MDDEPSRFYPELPTNAPSAAWLAARGFTLDLGPGASRLAGVLVVGSEQADSWSNNGDLQPMVRYATLAGNVATRVHLIDPSDAPDPTG